MIRDKLTFANVMSLVAVFIALGGSAMALKANSVGSRQIRNGSVKGRDVANGALKGKDLKRATITAREIEEASFSLERFFEMKSHQFGCDPASAAFVTCGTVVLGINEPSQALLIAAGETQSGTGTCKFLVDGSDDVISAPPSFNQPGDFALTAVTKANALLQPGLNTFKLVCNETSGDADFSTTFSVLALGGNG
jgi:hypothetical protein